jgi:hypothetical protein
MNTNQPTTLTVDKFIGEIGAVMFWLETTVPVTAPKIRAELDNGRVMVFELKED